MAVRVAINGFGRIGRLAFRQMFKAEGYDVVAINDLTSPDMLAYLLKYDTTHGRYDGKVEATENSIIVDGKEIRIYAVSTHPRTRLWHTSMQVLSTLLFPLLQAMTSRPSFTM